MNSNQLINQLCQVNFEVVVSDPWEFCDKFGTGPFYAKILKIEEKSRSVLLEFEKSFEKENKIYNFFSASIRHHGDELKHLIEGRMIAFGFLGLNEEHLKSSNPFDTSWWRGGGVTFIGTIQKSRAIPRQRTEGSDLKTPK